MKSVIFNIFKTMYICLILTLFLLESYICYSGYKHDALSNDLIASATTSVQSDVITENKQSDHTFTITNELLGRLKTHPYVYLMLNRQNIQTISVTLDHVLYAYNDDKNDFNIELMQNNIAVPFDTLQFTADKPLQISILLRTEQQSTSSVYFVDQIVYKRLVFIEEIILLIKRFIIFSSTMLSIGFIGFNKIIMEPLNRERAQSFYLFSASLIFFGTYSYVSQFSNVFLVDFLVTKRIEDNLYIITVLLLTFALYARIRDRLVLRLCILESVIVFLSIIIMQWFVISDVYYLLIKLSALLLAIIISYLYVNFPQIEKNIDNRKTIFYIILFLTVTQVVIALNFYYLIVPTNLLMVLFKMIPLVLADYAIIHTVFTEFITIQKENEYKQHQLMTLNTNIYEYISEGVFSIANNLLINELYTKSCMKIFGKDLSGMKVSELICDEDTDAALIERLLNDFFEGKISWIACKELMPQELMFRNRYYEINYQLIRGMNNQQEIVIRLKEISEQKELEDSVAFERDKLALSITSLMNREELVPLINEFIEFMQVENFSEEHLENTLNSMHTFKGNFGVFNFIHVLKAIHDLESKIIDDQQISQEMVAFVVDELYKDLEIISEITGSSFFEDTLYLKANINNLEVVYSEVKKYFYDTEASLIIYIIKKIFNKSLKDIILFYAREARKKAFEKNKDIKTIEVTGDDVFLDYQYYRHALRSLVHIFNNCIDHGIEDEEERLILGKPRVGEIQCRLSDFGNFVEIMIKDDGRGIDVEKLTKILLKEEIITEDQLTTLSEEEILEYVFLGEVSTLEEASMTSGRGVGLASVKKEVENVGGEIRISSFVDFGTEVKILIPKENDTLISYFSLPLLMDLYVEAFKIFIKSNNIFELPLNVIGSEKIPELYEFNVKIRFEGPENGYFFFSCNYEVLWKFACYLTDDYNLSFELFEEMKTETVKETCNIIAGNSTSVFDLNQKYIFIDSPEIIEQDLIDQFSLVYRWHMKYGDYGAILGLILD